MIKTKIKNNVYRYIMKKVNRDTYIKLNGNKRREFLMRYSFKYHLLNPKKELTNNKFFNIGHGFTTSTYEDLEVIYDKNFDVNGNFLFKK